MYIAVAMLIALFIVMAGIFINLIITRIRSKRKVGVVQHLPAHYTVSTTEMHQASYPVLHTDISG